MANRRTIEQEELVHLPPSEEPVHSLRVDALYLINEYQKPWIRAIPRDLQWLKEDYGKLERHEEEKVWVDGNKEELDKQYPFEITSWIRDWYFQVYWMLIHKEEKWGASLLDLTFFLTITDPRPTHPLCSYFRFNYRLHILQLRDYKEDIINTIYNNDELRTKILRGELIPYDYTIHMAYGTIRNKLIEKHHKTQVALRKEVDRSLHMEPPRWTSAALKLYKQGKNPEEIYNLLVKPKFIPYNPD